jgi:hypothetical protein
VHAVRAIVLRGSALGSVWPCGRQCDNSVRQCGTVRQCGSVWQCGSVRHQCEQQFMTVRMEVCVVQYAQ